MYGYVLSALALASSPFVHAQGLPQSQPKLLTIIQETVKPGLGADHAKHETGWPAAFEKAKSPDYYLAVTSMTGPTQAWYLVPQQSHAAAAETMKREDKDPVLSAELARLALRDAEFISGVRVVQTMARPDLSYGAFPDLAKVRFYEVTQFSVRSGQTAKFEALVQRYAAVRKRVAPDTSYRFYSVIAGMPGPTYLVFSTVDDYAKFDQTMATHAKTMSSATAEEKAEFDKWGDYVVREETQRFRVDPGQSYVPKETRAQDPEFWSPK
jgi:hypothetical protein